MRVFIKTNAKDIAGFPLPMIFYDEEITIKERHKHTSILKCGDQEVEVYNYVIKEKEGPLY